MIFLYYLRKVLWRYKNSVFQNNDKLLIYRRVLNVANIFSENDDMSS